MKQSMKQPVRIALALIACSALLMAQGPDPITPVVNYAKGIVIGVGAGIATIVIAGKSVGSLFSGPRLLAGVGVGAFVAYLVTHADRLTSWISGLS